MPRVGNKKQGGMRWANYDRKAMEESSTYASNKNEPMQVESYQYGGRVPGMRPRRRPRIGLRNLLNRLRRR